MFSEQSHTNPLLPGWLRDPHNAAAWKEFTDRYGPRIMAWCRRYDLPPADAEDVTQEILLLVHTNIQDFEYDPQNGRFRGWLHTITRNACITFFRRRRRRPPLALLDDPDARAGLGCVLDEVVEAELLDIALKTLRNEESDRDYDIFVRLTFDGIPPAQTARDLGLSIRTVQNTKSRLKRRLEEILLELGVAGDAPGGAV